MDSLLGSTLELASRETRFTRLWSAGGPASSPFAEPPFAEPGMGDYDEDDDEGIYYEDDEDEEYEDYEDDEYLEEDGGDVEEDDDYDEDDEDL